MAVRMERASRMGIRNPAFDDLADHTLRTACVPSESLLEPSGKLVRLPEKPRAESDHVTGRKIFRYCKLLQIVNLS